MAGLLDCAGPFPGTVGQSGWAEYVNATLNEGEFVALRRNTSTGRPTGDVAFVEWMENNLDRILERRKPGPKAASEVDTATGDMFEHLS